MKRGGELKRSPMRRKPLKKNGESDAQAVWRIVRQEVLERDQYCCQAETRGWPWHECWGQLHVHHIIRRSQGGRDHPSNCVTLCARAHDQVHANPELARVYGLLRRASEEPCGRCGHMKSDHGFINPGCAWGPYGMGCPCQAFEEAA